MSDLCGDQAEHPSWIPCMLSAGHGGHHWSTSGCAGGEVRWPNSPQWESVRVLRLEPGDAIVVRLDHDPMGYEFAEIKDQLSSEYPGHRVLVLGPGTDLEIVRGEGGR